VAISAICGKTFAKRRITIKICGKKAEGVKKISVKICVICGKKLREAKAPSQKTVAIQIIRGKKNRQSSLRGLAEKPQKTK
jgi:hypothetical protein